MPSHWRFGGLVETSIGMSLPVGLGLSPASVLGATVPADSPWPAGRNPGHGMPVRRYFGAELDPLPLLLLFIMFFFFAANARPIWDGRRG